MVLRIFVVATVLAGCVADDSPAKITVTPTLRVVAIAPEAVEAPDVCAEAAELPVNDICTLMCDPDAMKAELLAEGMHEGTCYEFSCPLPSGGAISVGVCLPSGS